MSWRRPFRDSRTEGSRTYTTGVRFPPGAPGYKTAQQWRTSLVQGSRTQQHNKAVKDVAADIFAQLLPSLGGRGRKKGEV